MAEVAGSLVSIVLARARDPDALATSRDTARLLLSSAQRFLNAAINVVTGTATLTLEPERQVYPVTPLLPACIAVTAVRDADRDLDMFANWRDLARYDRSWFRRTGSRPELWTAIGRDLLVVHPGLRASQSVTVVYTKLPIALTQDTDATEIPDANLPGVLDLTELLLNLKTRNFGSFYVTNVRLAQRISDAAVASVPPEVPSP